MISSASSMLSNPLNSLSHAPPPYTKTHIPDWQSIPASQGHKSKYTPFTGPVATLHQSFLLSRLLNRSGFYSQQRSPTCARGWHDLCPSVSTQHSPDPHWLPALHEHSDICPRSKSHTRPTLVTQHQLWQNGHHNRKGLHTAQ